MSIINTTSDSVIGTVTNPDSYSCGFSNPQAIAIMPDGTKAYVCNANNTVSVIDTAANIIINCVNDSACAFNDPVAIVITSDGTTAYVCNSNSSSVSIIDIATDTVLGCVGNPYDYPCNFASPTALAIAPNSQNTKVYVTNPSSSSVTVFTASPPPPPPITIFPPATVSGCKTKNIFLFQTDFINNITWTAPTSGEAPASYNIYRDAYLTDFITNIPASNALQYYDHDRQPKSIYSYYITSIDAYGNESTANNVTVINPC